MQALEPYRGRQALDFVDAIEASKTTASVISQFERMIAKLGFHAYIMAGIPTSGQSLKQLTVANGWPAEWFELYNRENLSAVARAGPATGRVRTVADLRHPGTPRRARRPARGNAAADRDHGIRHQRRAHRLYHRAGVVVASPVRALRLESASARSAADDRRHVGAGRAGRLRRHDVEVALQPDRPDGTDADMARSGRDQSPGSAGAFDCSSTNRSASAMSSSRCPLLRNCRKLFIKRSPETVTSSLFIAAGSGGIGMQFTADILDSML